MSARDSQNEIPPAGTIRIRFSLTPARTLPLLAAGLLCALALETSGDTTFNTQYPSPAGNYNRLTTTAQTWLAKDNGSVVVGPGGSGDDGYKMNVYGSLRATSDATLASSGGRLDAGGGAVLRSGADLSGFSAVNVGSPVNPSDVASKAYVESYLAQACGATSCDAPEPSCGQTTFGTNKCGLSCSKTKPVTDASCCDPNTCNAPAPACGQTTTGTLNCGQACSKKGQACCVSTTCGAPNPGCGQTTSGTDNCGKPCTKTGPACPPPCNPNQACAKPTECPPNVISGFSCIDKTQIRCYKIYICMNGSLSPLGPIQTGCPNSSYPMCP